MGFSWQRAQYHRGAGAAHRAIRRTLAGNAEVAALDSDSLGPQLAVVHACKQ
jgi:hypothetical protein